MIYVSSSCVKTSLIKDSIDKLHQYGFQNIEFSGGTRPYDEMESDILNFKNKYDLNYLCHNYFPPPQESFVLNLASLNKDIYQRSFNHVKQALELSARIGADKFAVHAGFLIDIPLNEVGESVSNKQLFDKDKAKAQFFEAVKQLKVLADKHHIKLYIENNVVSSQNFKNFGDINPFFVCSQQDAEEFVESVSGVQILIDLAHLKVSCKTLGLNFEEEAAYFLNTTDYVHLSDNDGLSDSNKEILEDSDVYEVLRKVNLKNKTFTLEVYTELDKVKETYNLINNLIYA
jgi:sugar phosphate isomerase/epimerase